MTIIFEALIMIAIVLLSFLLLGIVIPIGYTLGSVVSDKIDSFLSRL